MENKRYLKIFSTEEEYNAELNKNPEDSIIGDPHIVLIGEIENYNKLVFFDDTKNIRSYFTIEALEDITVEFSQNNFQYYIKGEENESWKNYFVSITDPILVNKGYKMQIKMNKPNISATKETKGIGTFKITGSFNVEGNIMSLLYGDDFIYKNDLTSKNSVFESLFKDCTTLQSAENLLLPATTLEINCYKNMFNGCSSLTTAPKLPATKLASSCYSYMFENCSSLTTAPELPATILLSYCYRNMFNNCTSLVNVHDFPYMTLGRSCCSSMFRNCTSLTTAPALPATTLVYECYDSMFSGCSSLTTAPELPATTLASYCYNFMFSGCKSLVNAPSLPATKLEDSCYKYMFRDCTSLTSAPELPATKMESNCYACMFQNCSSLTTATELPATTLKDSCYKYMFQNCSSLTTAPELKSTKLASSCYANMFEGCSSLTTAPELPATKLSSSCYESIFKDCIKLNYIKMLATDIGDQTCLKNWINNVSRNGILVKNICLLNRLLTTENIGIPYGWNVKEYCVTPSFINLTKTQMFFDYDADGISNIFTPNSDNNKLYYSESILSSLSPQIDIFVDIVYKKEGNDIGETIETNVSWERNINYGKLLENLGINYSINTLSIVIVDSLEVEEGGGSDSYYVDNNNNINYSKKRFSIVALEDDLSVQLSKNNNNIQYCIDDNDVWLNLNKNSTTESVYAGQKISFRKNSNDLDIDSDNGIGTFKINKEFDIEGNIMSLLYDNNDFVYANDLISHTFVKLFKDCTTLKNAKNLILPSTTLSNYCYSEMFSGCINLITHPVLPATYLGDSCYAHMFEGCSSLKTAPALPSNILRYYCYESMFQGCTSLTTAPELPAQTLTNYCYFNMFKGCSKIDYIKMLAKDISYLDCLTDWVSGVSSRGTFIKNNENNSLPSGESGIPIGWTEENEYEENE